MADSEKKSGIKGSIFKIIIVVFLAAILLGGGAFAGFIFANKSSTVAGDTDKNTNQVLQPKTFSLGDDFVVNLQSDGASRYLKAKIYLGFPDTEGSEVMESELESNKPIIRDAVNTVIRSKKAEEFKDEASVEKIKGEMMNRINPLLKEGQIVAIYFYEIIIQ